MLITISTPQEIVFFMASETDEKIGLTGLSPVVSFSKDGGVFAVSTDPPVEIASGFYKVMPTATEVNAVGAFVLLAIGTGAAPYREIHQVVSAMPVDETNIIAVKAKTDLLSFTGSDIKATLDGEQVVTDTASRNASKADISALATSAALVVIDTVADSIKAKTDLLNFTGTDVKATLDGEQVTTDSASRTASKADVSALATSAQIAALNNISVGQIFTYVVENGLTFEKLVRGLTAALMGKANGGGTSTIYFRNLADTKNRIAISSDNNGNRLSVTLDLT